MTPQFNTPDTESRLTDGVLAQKATYSDPAWVRFTRGVARSILFDIGAIAALQEVRIRLLKEKETAVRLPNNVSFSASVNGVDFENVALIDRFHSESDADIVAVSAKIEPAVKARFLRVTFCCPVHIYIDQIEAIGTKDASVTSFPTVMMRISIPTAIAPPISSAARRMLFWLISATRIRRRLKWSICCPMLAI